MHDIINTLAQTQPNTDLSNGRLYLAITLVVSAITVALVSFCNSRTPLAGDEH